MHKQMIFSLGILQLALISTVIATPTSPSYQSYQRDVSHESTTALSTLPDLPQENDLATLANFYPYHVPDIAVFMAAIRAMRGLSSHDFETANIPETSWFHSLFPGVKLTVRPAPGKRILSVRFAMWMILYTTRCLILEKEYSGEFLNLYKREMIGYVVILPTTPIAREGNSNTQTTERQNTKSFSNNSSAQNFSIGTVTDDEMQATVNYVGKNIDRADFFLALLWLIVDLAPHIEEPLTTWRVTRNSIHTEITTIWNRAKPPAGSAPYPINKGDLISMLAYLPEVCLHDRKFQEMNIEIRKSGEVIARGLVRTKPLLGLPRGPLIMNSTVA